MKIYTKVVYQWVGDELVTVEEESFDYEGPVAEAKGGGGGGQYYENLERLYGVQADQAELLGSAFRDTVLPAYRGWGEEAQNLGSLANREQAAADAAGASRAATTGNIQAMQQQAASLGLDPNDWGREMRIASIQGAAQEAGAATGAREAQKRLGLAATQDFVTAGMGTPTQATQAANAAISGNTSALNAMNQQSANQASAVSNIVRGGMNLGNWAFGRDGGYVLGLQNGGYVQRLAMGGMAGGMRPFGGAGGVPPPPPMTPAQPSTAQMVAGNAAVPLMAGQAGSMLGKGITQAGKLTGSSSLQSFGTGLAKPGASQALQQVGTAARYGTTPGSAQTGMLAAQDAGMYTAGENVGAIASQQVNSLLPEVVGTGAEAAAATGAEAVGTAAAAEAGTGTLAALGAEGVGAALGAAMPWVGGALAVYGIGSELGWWADGGPVGKVQPGSYGAQGGEVDGPGGPKDDLIPAMLSDGEFVLPVGTVKKYGLAKLEKMRQEGLDFEKQLGIGRR